MSSNISNRVIDLTQCISDGSATRWPSSDSAEFQVRHDEFLRICTEHANRDQAILHQLGGPVTFQGMPRGYGVFRRLRKKTKTRGHDDVVHGHPRGGVFRSSKQFLVHVIAIVTMQLDRCSCNLCGHPSTQGTSSVRLTTDQTNASNITAQADTMEASEAANILVSIRHSEDDQTAP